MHRKRHGMVAGGMIAACGCSFAMAGPQEVIDAAFATQEQGATLTQVRAQLAEHAGEDAVDFAMGAVDFLLAGEWMIQSGQRKGCLMTFAPIAGMVGPESGILRWMYNDDPEPTTYSDLDAAALMFVDKLGKADRTLGDAGGEFKCVLNLSKIRFDTNRDGVAEEHESLGTLFSMLPPRYQFNAENERYEEVPLVPENLTIAFDRGDASWLRGYCHLLMALGEWGLAHDGQELFDRTGHVFFPEALIKYDFLKNSTFLIEYFGDRTPTPFDVSDLIAFIGNFELPVDEPERMKAALEHLRATVRHGKEMWSYYDRETDNDREWVPNPNQAAGFYELAVDAEMRDAWLSFLDECDGILSGQKVLRFWRGDGSKGIDVVKVFEEPETFNLLYWIQGSAAGPYLREGEFTADGTWQKLVEVFDDRVFRFSFWFN